AMATAFDTHDATVLTDHTGAAQPHPFGLVHCFANRATTFAITAIGAAIVAPVAQVVTAAIIELDADGRTLIAKAEIDTPTLRLRSGRNGGERTKANK